MTRKIFLIILCLSAFVGSVNAAETIIFNDNFNDGSIVDWDVNSGTWTAAAFFLDGATLDGGAISHSVSMPAGQTYRIYYKDKPTASNVNGHFSWFTDQNGVMGVLNAYELILSTGGTTLRRVVNGANTTLISAGGVSSGSYHDVNITHGFDGNIQLWIDGAPVGSAIDTTFNKGTRINFGISNDSTNHNFDDLNILFTGDINGSFTVVDEETNVPIPSPTLLLNGNPWFVDTGGVFDINNQVTFPVTLEISKTGYSTRFFTFGNLASISYNRRFGLRVDTETNVVDFQFFQPDENTLLANRFVRLMHHDTVLSGAGTTNADGIITFVLNTQDPLYDFNIFFAGSESGDGNTEYRYSPITLTVLRPIDEKTNVTIQKQWSADLGGLGSQYQDANNNSKTFIILGNTVKTYDFVIDDSNITLDEYFPSTYAVNYRGDTTAESLQPYLVARTDGSEVTFIVYNRFNNTTISDLLVKASRNIAGSPKVVRSGITNGTGLVTFAFINALNYDIQVSDVNGLTIYFPDPGQNGSYNNTFSTYDIFITLDLEDLNTFVPNWQIATQPNSDILVASTSQYFDVNVNTNYAGTILFEYLDGNIPILSSSSNAMDKNFGFLLDTTQTGEFITLRITITADYRRDIYIQTYKIVDSSSNLGDSFTAFSNNTGIFGGLVILLCFIFIALQQFGPNLFGNNESQLFLVGLIMIGGGLLFFSTNFLPILIALAFGVIVYLQLRT